MGAMGAARRPLLKGHGRVSRLRIRLGTKICCSCVPWQMAERQRLEGGLDCQNSISCVMENTWARVQAVGVRSVWQLHNARGTNQPPAVTGALQQGDMLCSGPTCSLAI